MDWHGRGCNTAQAETTGNILSLIAAPRSLSWGFFHLFYFIFFEQLQSWSILLEQVCVIRGLALSTSSSTPMAAATYAQGPNSKDHIQKVKSPSPSSVLMPLVSRALSCTSGPNGGRIQSRSSGQVKVLPIGFLWSSANFHFEILNPFRDRPKVRWKFETWLCGWSISASS